MQPTCLLKGPTDSYRLAKFMKVASKHVNKKKAMTCFIQSKALIRYCM